jgi:hypothetical protein
MNRLLPAVGDEILLNVPHTAADPAPATTTASRACTGASTCSDPVVRFAHRGSPQRLERRELVRATVGLPLTLIAPGADEEGVIADAHALDVSGGGLLIGGLPAARIADEYGFTLDLGDGAPAVTGRGTVVHVAGTERAGLRFTELDEAGRIRLSQLAFTMSCDQRRSID